MPGINFPWTHIWPFTSFATLQTLMALRLASPYVTRWINNWSGSDGWMVGHAQYVGGNIYGWGGDRNWESSSAIVLQIPASVAPGARLMQHLPVPLSPYHDVYACSLYNYSGLFGSLVYRRLWLVDPNPRGRINNNVRPQRQTHQSALLLQKHQPIHQLTLWYLYTKLYLNLYYFIPLLLFQTVGSACYLNGLFWNNAGIY